MAENAITYENTLRNQPATKQTFASAHTCRMSFANGCGPIQALESAREPAAA